MKSILIWFISSFLMMAGYAAIKFWQQVTPDWSLVLLICAHVAFFVACINYLKHLVKDDSFGGSQTPRKNRERRTVPKK